MSEVSASDMNRSYDKVSASDTDPADGSKFEVSAKVSAVAEALARLFGLSVCQGHSWPVIHASWAPDDMWEITIQDWDNITIVARFGTNHLPAYCRLGDELGGTVGVADNTVPQACLAGVDSKP